MNLKKKARLLFNLIYWGTAFILGILHFGQYSPTCQQFQPILDCYSKPNHKYDYFKNDCRQKNLTPKHERLAPSPFTFKACQLSQTISIYILIMWGILTVVWIYDFMTILIKVNAAKKKKEEELEMLEKKLKAQQALKRRNQNN